MEFKYFFCGYLLVLKNKAENSDAFNPYRPYLGAETVTKAGRNTRSAIK